MTKPINLFGQKFGKLSPIENIGYSKERKTTLWKLKCDCGNIITTTLGSLRSGNSTSCGCNQKEAAKLVNWKGYGKIPYTYFKDLKNKAKKRKLDFDITIEYIWNLFIEQKEKCNITGEQLIFTSGKKRGTASLDRIDSSKGYVKGNVQWVHKTINGMKSDLESEEFISWCKKVSKYNENSN